MRRTAHIAAAIAAVLAIARAQSDYERGVALVEKGSFQQAVPLLTQATRATPNDARAWKALAVAYAAQNLYNLAEPAFRRACELNPRLEDACYYLGRALYALDRYDGSLKVLTAAGRLEPESWKITVGIAQALEALGRALEADQTFQLALKQSRNADPSAGVAYGRYLVRQGRLRDAIAPLEAVLAKFPNSADAHTHLGRALLESGSPTAAIPHLERAVVLAPDSAQAHLLLAKSYVAVGRPADAQPHFEAAARDH